MASEMRLYVWQNCFLDYTPGLCVVLASSAEEARQIGRKAAGCDNDDFAREPECFPLTEPVGFFVYGGS